MVHGPVREVVRGPGPLDWSTDRGSVFSGHPLENGVRSGIEPASRTAPIFTRKKAYTDILSRRTHKVVV